MCVCVCIQIISRHYDSPENPHLTFTPNHPKPQSCEILIFSLISPRFWLTYEDSHFDDEEVHRALRGMIAGLGLLASRSCH